MKSLVVYYSRTGNTEKVAKLLARELRGDLEKIVDMKNRSGFFGYLSAAWDTIFKAEADIEELEKKPAQYDLVVIGTPIWSWGVSAPVRTFLDELAGRAKRAAFFCTGENGESKVFVQMTDLFGQKPLEKCLIREKSISNGSYEPEARGFAAKLKSHFGLA